MEPFNLDSRYPPIESFGYRITRRPVDGEIFGVGDIAYVNGYPYIVYGTGNRRIYIHHPDDRGLESELFFDENKGVWQVLNYDIPHVVKLTKRT